MFALPSSIPAPITLYTLPPEDIILAVMDIPPHGTTRREAERNAVTQLLHCLTRGNATITHTPSGAPLLEYDESTPQADRYEHISVSHSRTRAAVALSRHSKIGIDIEEYRPSLEKVAPRFATPADLESIKPLTPDASALLAAWTIKEAAYKASTLHAPDFLNQIAILPRNTIKITAGDQEQTLTLLALIPHKTSLLALLKPS